MAYNKKAEVKREDLLNIKVGTSVTFTVRKLGTLDSIRSMASHINKRKHLLKKELSCTERGCEVNQIIVTANKL